MYIVSQNFETDNYIISVLVIKFNREYNITNTHFNIASFKLAIYIVNIVLITRRSPDSFIVLHYQYRDSFFLQIIQREKFDKFENFTVYRYC